MKKEGFNELAAEVSNQGKAADAPGILAKAKKQAEDEASEKAAWWRPDSTDFADDEGSPTKYIERRTKEIAAELSGEGGKTLPEKPKADQTPYTGDTQPRGHPGAKKADDGFWYVERNGKHHQIVNDDATAGNGEIIDITGTQQSQKDQLAKVPVGARVCASRVSST